MNKYIERSDTYVVFGGVTINVPYLVANWSLTSTTDAALRVSAEIIAAVRENRTVDINVEAASSEYDLVRVRFDPETEEYEVFGIFGDGGERLAEIFWNNALDPSLENLDRPADQLLCESVADFIRRTDPNTPLF